MCKAVRTAQELDLPVLYLFNASSFATLVAAKKSYVVDLTHSFFRPQKGVFSVFFFFYFSFCVCVS